MSEQVYARPAVLLTHTRSGGTFLNYCLSTHRRIFWVRGEPLLRQMEWGKAFPVATDLQFLSCITRAAFYTVAGCKITYEQLTPEIWEWLHDKNVRILHLVRENLLRVAVSQIMTGLVVTQQLKGHRAHSFNVLKQPRVSIRPDRILARIVRQEHAIAQMKKKLYDSGLPTLHLTYSQLVGSEGEEARLLPQATGEEICGFLGVRYEEMSCDLRRVNRAPLTELLTNWSEVEAALKTSKYKKWL